jgi:hypothetical protein
MARGEILRRFTLAALAVAFTACSEPVTGPSVEEQEPRPLIVDIDILPDPPPDEPPQEPPGENTLALVQCAPASFGFRIRLLGPLGGLLALDGHSLLVPLGALLNLAFVTIKEPATTNVEAEFRVNFRDHFQFAKPVTISLDYSRCDPSSIGPDPLTIVEIDPDTKQILREVGGVNDPVARRISVDVDHFSGYALAQ